MQNLPLLNTPNTAPKANTQAASKSNNLVEQPNDSGSFQQKLMHQIHQKSAHQQTAAQGQQAPKAGQKTEAAEGKTVADSETPANDFISRKIKGLVGKATATDNISQDTSLAIADKVLQSPVADDAVEAGDLVDTTLVPASLNVLAQIQQSAAKETGAAVGKPASDAAEGDDTGMDLAAGDELSTKKDAAGNAKSAQTGLDKAALAAAGNQRAQSEDFDSMVTESLNKTAAPKEAAANIMQNQVMSATQTAAANLANNSLIMAHPGKEGWNQAIGQRVMWMVGATQQSATLTLNPPEMGPLQIVINVHNDKADTTFFSDRQEVRQALQDGMDNLREMMKEAGINLGQTNINQRDKTSQEFMHQQQAAQQNLDSKEQAAQESSVSASPTRAGLGLVDTFA